MSLPQLDLSSVKFLIADDNGFMRTIMRELMCMMHCHNLVFASNGDEALEVLETYQPDIIITNWHMPVVNGIELIRNIRARTGMEIEMVSIIILTAHTEAAQVAEARDAGANEFLAKPISAKVLYSRLVSLVVNPRPFVRSIRYIGPCRRRHSSMHYVGDEHRKTGL